MCINTKKKTIYLCVEETTDNLNLEIDHEINRCKNSMTSESIMCIIKTDDGEKYYPNEKSHCKFERNSMKSNNK